jgi:hypothetical protein
LRNWEKFLGGIKEIMVDYLIWDSEDVQDACALQKFEGVEDSWEIAEGAPRAATWPENVTLAMDPEYPDDTLLVDNLININMLIVASRQLKEFLETQALPMVEYLPVTILDHKGRVASSDYFIIHPIHPVDCLKLDECDVTWDVLDANCIDTIGRLVIDESRIDPDHLMLRVKFLEGVILIRRALAGAIDAMGFIGIEWLELDDYER